MNGRMMMNKILIWVVGVSFVLLQFSLQLSSGVLMNAIMHDMHLSALMSGALSASFYVIYTSLQIPVGLLFDRYNPRLLLTASSFVCALGCFIFANSHHLFGLFLGRSVIGAGSAFAFVGLSHLLREYFPKKQFAFMIGLSETIGFLAAVISIIGMETVIQRLGWQQFIYSAGFVGLVISVVCWQYIPVKSPTNISNKPFIQQIAVLIKNKYLWINGLFIGLSFTIVTVFGALWAIPFLQQKLGQHAQQASVVTACFFLGASLSCPVFGVLSTRFMCRKLMIFVSLLSTTGLFLILLYVPTQNSLLLSCLLFAIGLCCGAYILAYPIANELAPIQALSACTGFINTLALVTTPLLQPLVGYCLDAASRHHLDLVTSYQLALLIIPATLLMSCLLVRRLPSPTRHINPIPCTA